MNKIDRLRLKYKDKEDERFFRELFEQQEYSLVLKYPLDVVLDIGALAGEFSAYVYQKAGFKRIDNEKNNSLFANAHVRK